MKPYELAKNGSSALAVRLGGIRMSPSERRMASAYLHQGELFADMLMRAYADLRVVLGFAGRGVGAVARRSKPRAVMPEPN